MKHHLIAVLKQLTADSSIQTLDQLWEYLEPKRQRLHDQWVKEGSPDTFEEWQKYMDVDVGDLPDIGDPLEYFSEIEYIKKPQWVVHFTKSDSNDLVKKPLKGVGIESLALSEKGSQGSYIFGFAYDDEESMYENWYGDDQGHQYGNSFLFVKIKEGISVFHNTDGEMQIIFTNNEIVKKIPGILKNAKFIVNDHEEPAHPGMLKRFVDKGIVS